jgi:hypothetical protein
MISLKKLKPVESLKFDPANSRKHDERNIKAIMESLKRHGQRKPIVCYSDVVIAGNGTLEAAKRLGWTEIWVNDDSFDSIEDAKAYALQDNRSAELATWDDVQLEDTLKELKDKGWDIEAIGFTEGDLELIKEINKDKGLEPDSDSIDDDDLYTKKIEAPIYKPTGEKPPVSELYDQTKFKELVEEIKSNTNLTEEVRDFLQYAATRHVVFNYQNIAEFYAHADKETQELMERSALVIIDFDKAIENGFVEMSKDISKLYEIDHDEL